MNQQKSIYLYLKGEEAWNMWAMRLLRRKQVLIKRGVWAATTEFDFEKSYFHTRGLNKPTQAWLERALVDFSGLEFQSNDKYSNKAKAKKRLDIDYAVTKLIPVQGINIDFRNFIFPGDALFNETSFKGNTLFNNADFYATAWFSDAKFQGTAWFKQAKFRGHACFHQTEFKSYTTFMAANFQGSSNFEAINANKTFVLTDTSFIHEVPSFVDANFKQVPRITNVHVLPAPTRTCFSPRIRSALSKVKKESRRRRKFFLTDLVWSEWMYNRVAHSIKLVINARRNKDDELHFRSLKTMANEAGDQQRERAFYAGEIRARRHLKDKVKNFPTGLLRYLFGATYELTTNFGRSLSRPIICWVAVFYAFSYIYLASSSVFYNENCQGEKGLSPFEAAKTISLNNALLFGNNAANKNVSRAHSCLNNSLISDDLILKKIVKENKDQSRLTQLAEAKLDDEIITGAISDSKTTKKEYKQVHVNRTFLTNISLVQMTLHMLLMGMFFLVLRNHFKMK